MSLMEIGLTNPDVVLTPQQPLKDALTVMLSGNIECAPVCQDGRVIAVLAFKDVLDGIIPISARVEHGLSDLAFAGDSLRMLAHHLLEQSTLSVGVVAAPAGPRTVLKADCPVLEAVLLLSKRSPLPVAAADGSLKGMVDRAALLTYLTRQPAES